MFKVNISFDVKMSHPFIISKRVCTSFSSSIWLAKVIFAARLLNMAPLLTFKSQSVILLSQSGQIISSNSALKELWCIPTPSKFVVIVWSFSLGTKECKRFLVLCQNLVLVFGRDHSPCTSSFNEHYVYNRKIEALFDPRLHHHNLGQAVIQPFQKLRAFNLLNGKALQIQCLPR